MQSITAICRDLRKNMTTAEKLVWAVVRNNGIGELKFRRQHPIAFMHNSKPRFFITDFCCIELKLILEIDGKVHHHQQDYDQLRDDILNEFGYHTIRITNKQIFKNMKNLKSFLENHLLPLSAPLCGEGAGG